MTCSSCEAKVKSALLVVENVVSVDVSKDQNSAIITMDKHISLDKLKNALPNKYQISAIQHSEVAEQAKSWFATYKPLLIIFAFITGISFITSFPFWEGGGFWMKFMNNFMAGFFLTFSFFKLLDVKAFAQTYSMYDIVAKRIKVYGFIYPFIELALGIAFLTEFNPFVTNIVTLIVMSVSILGVLISVVKKQKIQCACLGAVFNLPMSTVTIIEDALMIAMSIVMLNLIT